MKPKILLPILVCICASVSCTGTQGTESTTTKVVNLNESTTISCELIDNWERAKVFTRKYLEAMPEDHYDFQPTPEIQSFSKEFLHVACVNFRYAAMIAGSFDCAEYDDVFNDPNIQSKEQIIDFVMASYDAMIDRLKQENNLGEATYYYRWSCSKECLAMKGFEHQSHHRGKAAIYLRLKGITPPVHMLIEKWDMPQDISEEDWMGTEAYTNYEKLVDKN